MQGYSIEDRLGLDEIAVHLFRAGEDGSSIRDVPVDADFGISEEGFVEVAEEIGDETWQLTSGR